jgi:hypothetical protein
MYGRILEQHRIQPDQTLRIGNSLRPGTYTIKGLQGDLHQQVKLIKLPK